jgi:hypothetical protein
MSNQIVFVWLFLIYMKSVDVGFALFVCLEIRWYLDRYFEFLFLMLEIGYFTLLVTVAVCNHVAVPGFFFVAAHE